jgi:hypothetical protein
MGDHPTLESIAAIDIGTNAKTKNGNVKTARMRLLKGARILFRSHTAASDPTKSSKRYAEYKSHVSSIRRDTRICDSLIHITTDITTLTKAVTVLIKNAGANDIIISNATNPRP